MAKLTDEQKSLLQLEIDTLDETWMGALKEELLSKNFLDLKRFLQKEKGAKRGQHLANWRTVDRLKEEEGLG